MRDPVDVVEASRAACDACDPDALVAMVHPVRDGRVTRNDPRPEPARALAAAGADAPEGVVGT